MFIRALLLSGVLLAAGSLAGCLIIPTDYYVKSSRKNTSEEPPETVVAGKTTREEVLLNLGEPDAVSPDETEIWYDAEKVKAWLIMGDRGGEVVRHYLSVILFNRNGIVESSRIEVSDTILPDYNLEPHFSRTPVCLPGKRVLNGYSAPTPMNGDTSQCLQLFQ